MEVYDLNIVFSWNKSEFYHFVLVLQETLDIWHYFPYKLLLLARTHMLEDFL